MLAFLRRCFWKERTVLGGEVGRMRSAALRIAGATQQGVLTKKKHGKDGFEYARCTQCMSVVALENG